MLTCVIQIEMHLSRIRMRELAEFEINNDETPEPSVEEHQVDPIPLVSDTQEVLKGERRPGWGYAELLGSVFKNCGG